MDLIQKLHPDYYKGLLKLVWNKPGQISMAEMLHFKDDLRLK